MSWPYKSSEDLARAGFRCRGAVQCPHCDVEIWIYQQPDQMPVFLNSQDYWPHLVTEHNHEAPPAAPLDGKTIAAGGDR